METEVAPERFKSNNDLQFKHMQKIMEEPLVDEDDIFETSKIEFSALNGVKKPFVTASKSFKIYNNKAKIKLKRRCNTK